MQSSAARRALVFWALGVLVLALVIVVHEAVLVLLFTFTGLLFGTTLRGTAEWLAHRTPLSLRGSLAACIGVLIAVVTLALVWIVPHVDAQVPVLWKKLEQAAGDLKAYLTTTTFGSQLFERSVDVGDWLRRNATTAANVAVGVFGVLGAVLYILFFALYFAVSPDPYRRGVLALVPVAHRARAGEVLDAVGRTLRRWLWGRLFSMTFLGIASTIGLALLGIPLALTLGLLAGTLLFVPYLGSIAASIPALLIALTVSPMHVLYVGALYIAIHLIDGYLLDPVLQRYATFMPPLLLLGAQLVAGELWGIVGLMIATPLVAALRVAIQMVYVEDILHSSPPPPPRPPESAEGHDAAVSPGPLG